MIDQNAPLVVYGEVENFQLTCQIDKERFGLETTVNYEHFILNDKYIVIRKHKLPTPYPNKMKISLSIPR